MPIIGFARFIIYIFYYYYCSSPSQRNLAYSSSLMSTGLLIFMNILALSSLFHVKIALPVGDAQPTLLQYAVVFFAVVLPSYLILSFIAPKAIIKEMSFDVETIRAGNTLVLFYVALTFLAVVIL